MMDNMYTGYKKNINRSEVREQIRSNLKNEDKINNIYTKPELFTEQYLN